MTDEFSRDLIVTGLEIGAIMYGAHIRKNALDGAPSVTGDDVTTGNILMWLGAAGLALDLLPSRWR
jgi:hypothetical protein